MTEKLTDLDRAHAAMEAGGDAGRLAFYACLADSELVVWLDAESDGSQAAPKILPVDAKEYVLAFDQEERLADLAGQPEPFLALPGRALAGMLAGQGTGIALNMGAAPSAMLIPASAVDWLAGMLTGAAQAASARPVAFSPPAGLPDGLAAALAARLAAARPVEALLALAAYEGGGQGYLVALAGTDPGIRQDLADTIGEAVRFSGAEGLQLDVVFLDPGDPALPRLRNVGHRLEVRQQPPIPAARPKGPGTDPAKPPRLR